MNLISEISQCDTRLFLFLNRIHTQFFDQLMFSISQHNWIWTPFYCLILWLIIQKYGIRCWLVIVLIILLIAVSDQISSSVLKELTHRLRPTYNPMLLGLVHTVNNYFGGKYGFVSSHASNSFATACFISLVLNKRYVTLALFSWSSIISYSRIYLGVHYPGDVLGGILLGISCALFFYWIAKIIYNKIYHDELHPAYRK